jgi:molecular chaperone DnaK (HSP70)
VSCEAVGIDLGTTYSVIAHINAVGQPEVIPNAEGQSITPSVIYFGSDPPVVGEAAKHAQGLGETEVASFFKRSMGDPHFLLHLAGKDRTPVELSALVLAKLKTDAEAVRQRPVTQAVITVPAYFNDAQRQATIAAGQRARLEVLQIINEPTAAALAYRIPDSGRPQTLLVYDLGGGTFDVSLVRMAPDELTVLATAGDHNLGGKDWDDRIAAYLGQRFAEVHGTNPLDETVSCHDLLVRAESAKKSLSARDATRVAVHHQGVRDALEITRTSFEELTRDLMERTQRLAEQVLQDKGVRWTDLNGVLLVGGSTRMPMVRDYVRRMSGKEPLGGVNVDEAVALGAAITAATRLSEKPLLLASGARRLQDVMSHSLGMIAESPDRSRYLNSIILPKNRPIPDEATRPYQLRTRVRGATDLEVYMTQGESEDPRACSFLGKYHFADIGPGGSGIAVLDVTYRYDVNGVVQVSARERGTGRSLPMTVEPLPEDMSWLDRPPKDVTASGHLTAYLAFDLSGSMAGAPLAEAQAAAREFVRQSDLAHTAIGLISFADAVATDIKASQNAKALERAIAGMHIGPVGIGNAATPFAHAHRLLKGMQGSRFIILLTDGVWSCQRQAIQEAQMCRAENIEIIAIGFGGADRAFLGKVATSEKSSFFARAGELVSTFSTIAQELTETGAGTDRKKRGLRFF